MLGVLQGVIHRAQPLVPDLKIVWRNDSYRVIVRRKRYTMGIAPKLIGESEEELVNITIEHDEENDRIVVLVNHGAVHQIPATVATAGQDQASPYQWRIEDAAKELADYLRKLAAC